MGGQHVQGEFQVYTYGMDYSISDSVDSPCRDGTVRTLAAAYCDLRGRIKGAAGQ